MDGPVTKRARDIGGPPSAPRRVRFRRQRRLRSLPTRVRREGEAARPYRRVGCKTPERPLRKPCRVLIARCSCPTRRQEQATPHGPAGACGRPRLFHYLRERLLVRVLPEGQKCVCGADASNEHVHTCTRLQQNPRTTRHDMINMTSQTGCDYADSNAAWNRD
ncbi:putative SLACS reverse transcriptase [Trypanosoma cruzi]|uniref:Putative SLACS reverse transcriptase n=1 Tax=Trypanosoma cruzi TaxID=5693 RepID=A0A2V2UPR5_TRYCR|nr:putative SLACS reverse transcriptase [Trypanosoma cruzi]